jgi:hypothetical protein
MKYQVVESFHRVKPDGESRRKDHKTIHELGECESVEDARELAHIWFGLMDQSGNLGNLVRDTRVGRVIRLRLQDEEGNTYRWEKPRPQTKYDFWMGVDY